MQKVKCVKNFGLESQLTIGKEYEVKGQTQSVIWVEDDRPKDEFEQKYGKNAVGFSRDRFAEVVPAETFEAMEWIPVAEAEPRFIKGTLTESEDWEILKEDAVEPEYTGSSVSYYAVPIKNPTNKDSDPYVAECNDIIKALKMSYCEGNAFKAIWRSCAARNLGLAKKGYDNGLYDAEKVVFFGNDMVEAAKENK